MNPKIREYLLKKRAIENRQSEAQDTQDMVGYTNVAGNLANDFANSQKEDVIFGNKLANLGDAPRTSSTPDRQYDDLGAGRMAAQGVASADRDMAQLGDMPTVRDEEDPGSPISKLWQETAAKAVPGKDLSPYSAAQIKSIMPNLTKFMPKASTSNVNYSGGGRGGPNIDTQIKEQRLENMRKPKPLSGEMTKRSDNVDMALKAILGMQDALEAGDNTFSLVGDNDYTSNRARWNEAFGRMQSGGAIQKDEIETFENMAPTVWDSADMQKKKLKWMEGEMRKRRGSIDQLAPPTNNPTSTPTSSHAKDIEQMTDAELEAELNGQ